MSVTVNLVMQGDLDNPKHREICGEIASAINAVINKHTGNTSTQLIISETKQSSSEARRFEVEGTNPFNPRSAYVEHKLHYSNGFHFNTPPVATEDPKSESQNGSNKATE